MNDTFMADVVVVGAGTAGTYFAWQQLKKDSRSSFSKPAPWT